ncbi:unnamed protein product [Toxocara canis]|uniref:Cadherin domain-containing protein n=1 Tax=Toxocara canis TaxID=6265 RepID=A0A183V8D2_TOXCA|nr:unnamed protein product [Toxocara canis]
MTVLGSLADSDIRYKLIGHYNEQTSSVLGSHDPDKIVNVLNDVAFDSAQSTTTAQMGNFTISARVECDKEIFARVNDSSLLPAAAHDIRVEPFARAMPRRSQQKYQLSVDISWQMPPNSSLLLLH